MLGRIVRWIDAFQQRHAVLGFPHAVIKKFGEDRGGQQATLLAYYGFFSLLPLLLVAVTVLGFVLRDNPDLRERLLDSAISQFPVIGEHIRDSLHSIEGSSLALAIGLVGAFWGGLGGIRAMQDAMNVVWDVPHRERPGFPNRLLPALLMLLILGGFALVSTALSAIAAGGGGGVEGLARAITIPGSIILNVVTFLLAFKVLTTKGVSWRDVFPGAVVAGVAWAGLQAAGTYIVGSRLEGASQLYGVFGIVIGLVLWLYLGAQVTLLAAEVNVVRKYRLWPRAIDMGNLTGTDREALGRRARVEERVKGQRISVSFEDANKGSDADEGSDREPNAGKVD
ncbi:MAG: YihY/virulence factor BrkB family protein [Actinomycetota bacterium]